MPRKKAKATDAETTISNAVTEQVADDRLPGIDPNSEPAHASSSADDSKQFRSWVVDTEHGYTRLTDEVNKKIVIQFAQKPDAEVLSSVKTAGFRYYPTYEGQKNCWVRADNYQGRLQIEGIEKKLRSETATLEATDR